jgi:galactokinase
VAGAPCGLMDQMTCVFGREDSLLALLCQPAELQPAVTVPGDITFFGLDSGERHAIGGADYGSVRTAAFMGRRLVAEQQGTSEGYLVNLTPSVFEEECRDHLPAEMSGAAFLERHRSTFDTVTTVDPARVYRIRQSTAHPIYEHHRVRTFRQLLLATPCEERRVLLGELMYQSHASYSACGLGSHGTDLLVELVRAEGSAAGLYGARVTGGGSGGTVAVLARSDAAAAVARVVDTYARHTGYHPYVFSGSSYGVASFGAHEITL